MSFSEPSKILVLSASGIGINLLCLPLLRQLRAELPQARLDVLVRFEAGKQLLEPCEVADRIFVLPKGSEGLLGFLLRLRAERYDTAISSLPGNRLDKNLTARFTGAARRIAHRYQVRHIRNGGFLNTHLEPLDATRHDVEHNLALLRPLGLAAPARPDAYLPSAPEWEREAARWLADRGLENTPLLGMHPGSSLEFGMEYKRWPAGRFAAAAAELGEELQGHWLVFGGSEEQALARQVTTAMPRRATAVALPIGPVAELLRRCRLFLSNDSGIMHLAAAVGAPVVAVFGPTDYRRTRPWGETHTVVRAGIDCSPCFRVETLGEPFHCVRGGPDCLREVGVEDVMQACRRVLQRQPAR